MLKVNRKLLLLFFMIFISGIFLGNLLIFFKGSGTGAPGSGVKLSFLSREVRNSLFRDINDENLYFEFSGVLERLSANIPLILITRYIDTDREERKIIPMPSPFTGLTISALESHLKDWQLKDYHPKSGLVLYREEKELVPVTASLHLGIIEDKVAIFYNNGDRTTGINVDMLPEEEVARLEKGINITSQEELLTLLEGLQSYLRD
ncbi:MAG: BofC C-terminal domain-containing protein [Bacillota bacterium]